MATTAAAVATNPGPKPAGKPLDQAAVRRVLSAVLDRAMAAAPDVEYRCAGSASSVLRGIDMAAGDIDILVKERPAVDRFGAAVMEIPGAECLSAPAPIDRPRQYFARYLVDGATVEVSTVEVETDSDAMECFGTGPWTHFDLVPCGRHLVPVARTELRLISELTRNRTERCGPLLAYLRQHGCDVALVQRGMAVRQIPAARQAEILEQLAGAPASTAPPATRG